MQDLVVSGTPGRYLTITFTRRSDASDLGFIPEISNDLNAWAPATPLLPPVSHPDGSVTETWRSAGPVSDAARLYIRVRVP